MEFVEVVFKALGIMCVALVVASGVTAIACAVSLAHSLLKERLGNG